MAEMAKVLPFLPLLPMQKISLTIKNDELEDFFILFLAYMKKKQYLCIHKGFETDETFLEHSFWNIACDAGCGAGGAAVYGRNASLP